MFIRLQGALAAGEGCDQHQQRRSRQVKVSQHRTHHAKFKSRINEDVGLAGLRRDPAIGGAPPFGKLRAGPKLVLLGWASARGNFQRTHRCGSHRHDSPPVIARAGFVARRQEKFRTTRDAVCALLRPLRAPAETCLGRRAA